MHLSAPIRSHEPRVLSPSSYRTSESTTGLVDHLLHSRPTGTQPVHFPAVRPTFGHLLNTFSSSPLSPKPSLTCLGPSLGMSISHLRPPHISWLSHHSQVCCSTLYPVQGLNCTVCCPRVCIVSIPHLYQLPHTVKQQKATDSYYEREQVSVITHLACHRH